MRDVHSGAKRTLFACDLDGTLFRSWRAKKQGDIQVEALNGRGQSYMSRQAAEMLRAVMQTVEFVPVTSRSSAQYARIEWPDGCRPKRAVLCNGAVLVQNGAVSTDWTASVCGRMERDGRILHRARAVLQRFCTRLTSAYIADGVMVVGCFANEHAAARALSECGALSESLTWTQNGRKIYGMLNGCGKAAALCRLAAASGISRVVAAGDALADIEMLRFADYAIASLSLRAAGFNPRFSARVAWFSDGGGDESVLEHALVFAGKCR